LNIHESSKDRISSIRIVAVYVLFGSLWILLSDTIVGRITNNPDLMKRISVFKGIAFVLITAFLLYHLINRHLRRLSAINSHLQTNMNHLQTVLEKLKLTDLSIDNISDSIQWITMDTHFWNVNQAACSMLGYNREELLSLSISDIDPYFTLEEWQTHLQEIRLSGNVNLHTRFHKAKDGRIFPVEVTCNYIKYNGIEYYCAIVRDIAGRVTAEQEASFFRTLIEYTRDPFYVLSPENGFRMVYANRAACEHFGMELEQLQTMCIPDWDPAFEMGNIDVLTRQMREGHSTRFETVHRVASGTLIPVEVTSCLLEHDGQEYTCGYFYDITERKRIEEALRESEERYRALIELSPDAIFIRTGGRLIFANAEGAKLLGVEKHEDIYGREALEFIHPDNRELVLQRMAEALQTGEPSPPTEITLIGVDGSQVPVEVASVPFKYKGEISLLTIAHDITDRKRMQEELLKTQKLESLGVLAGGIAHDFNNILTAIIGNVSLARMQVGEGHKAAARLAVSEKALARATDLTRQLLTFARGGEPIKKIIEVGGLIKEAASFAIHGSTVKCQFVLANDLWLVEADEGQLSQVIQNLVINARQAMPEGGTLTLKAENIRSTQEGKKFVHICVADSGAGITENHLQRIFDPYFTTKQLGSGLGLATCYSIIKRHGGNITVTSTLGKGSTFYVDLPASDQGSVVEAGLKMEVVHGSGRVLVMDDEEPVRQTAQAMLEELGYMVECTKNVSDTVDLYRQRREEGTPFSAVIMDLTIPGGIGGKEAINFLHKIDPNVKAIVSSGYSTDPVMANYSEFGFVAVLRKPYRPQEMSVLLRDCLSSDDLQPSSFN
jgi:PAS domain S-box-containing protein